MLNIVVQPVKTARQKKQFLEFPWKLYQGDPNWIPPLRGNQKEVVGYKPHPFYDRNSIQTFLAYRDGEVRGRIAAILNLGHIERYDDLRGFFGFFECDDDQEAADGLFDAVRRWFAGQGIYNLRGPTNPSLNHELGLLIDGFDSSPSFMMTYNPPYYERLIESYGFRKTQDLYAFWGQMEMLPKISEKLNPIAEQIIERYDVKLRSLDRSRFLEDVEMFLSIYNRSLVGTWGFVPMSADEVRHMARGLKRVIVPEMTVAAEIDGRVVGVAFGLPDYNPRIKKIDGRLFPFGFIHLLRNPRAIKRIRLISTNVLPEYQLMGVGLVLMYGLLPKAIDWELEGAEFSWVLESNSLSYGSLKKGGAKITKTYRLYDLDAGGEERETGVEERGERREEREGKSEKQQAIAVADNQPLAVSQSVPTTIREVRLPGDLDHFIKMPWRIYTDDPQWSPPLLIEVKRLLDRRKHPFYKHGEATQFIAMRGEECVGRVLVSDDSNYNEQHSTEAGCFGMFECIDDRPTAHALLDAAADWLKKRGRTTILGPIDYSTNYQCGLLIKGFHTPPRVMMNHNRPYYAGLLESWGLRKAKDLYAWWFVDTHDLASRWQTRVERIAKRSGVVVRSFRMGDFENEVIRCKDIYNEAMGDLWGFVKLTDEEFVYLAKQLKRTAIANHILIAEIDGRPVGFSITLPDINEATGPLNGRLTSGGLPLGLLKFMRGKRRIKTARMVVLDVLKKYRRRGVAEMLILRTLDYGTNTLGYTAAELSWTFDDNDLVNRSIEAVGAKRYKTYRIFEKEIG